MSGLYSAIGFSKDDVLAGNFIPFRSPNWHSLKNKSEAIEFSRRLWTWVLQQSPAKLIFCLGHEATRHIVEIENAKEVCRRRTGWGSTNFIKYKSNSGRIIVDVPHLSRYRIFGRNGPKSDEAVANIREICEI